MQQFTVPQFIDVEDKIIGPITTRQFVVLLGAFLLLALLYQLLSFHIFLFFAIIIIVVSLTFAFARINGRPFHYFAENFVRTALRPNLRVWNQGENIFFKEEGESSKDKIKETGKDIEKHTSVAKQSIQKSRLNELSLMVDTRGNYKGD